MKIKDLCSYAPKSKIKAGEAVENAKYIFFTSSADENKRYTDFQFDKEAIIMGTGGNATLHYYNGKFSVSTDCLVLFPNSKIKCKYLYYFFKSHMSVLEAGFKGAGLKHTNKKYIEEINVSEVPDLTTQEKIIFHLDTISGNIEKLNRELELFDSLTKARFIEMFGEPVNNDKVWAKDSVERLCREIYGGGTPSKSHPEYYEGGKIPWITSKDMKTDILIDSQIHINEDGVANSTARIVPKNSVIMVIRSGILKHTLPVAINAVPVTVNQDLKVFVAGNRIVTKFLAYQFKMMERDILSGVRAVTADNIEFDALKRRELIVPPIELQQEFADFVRQVDKSKLAVQKSLEKTQQLFDSLMQKYFG